MANGFAVSDLKAMSAISLILKEMKILVEPGEAVAVAAAQKHAEEWEGKSVVAIVSGSNADLSLIADCALGASCRL
ncbi:hypothetical protein RSK20926_03324 [Roseobacter sp. SK209-2-6]|nr:hypothetical protein RSK20926_03324 [Roseobacter sp. SK209-2-6]